MSNVGYRTEELYGEGYRNASEVMNHEVFYLQNTDIIDTLSDTILKDTEYEESLKRLSNVINGNIEDDELDSLCEDAYEDESIGINYFEDILDKIYEITGKRVEYVLWLCDSIDDIIKEYEKIDHNNFTCFDSYEKSDIVLSDLGNGGKLYGYENNPKPILTS